RGTWLDAPMPLPPKLLKSPPARPTAVVQSVQPVLLRSAQSATHSSTFPTMSNTPQLDLQFVRLPVFDGPPEFVLQSLAPGVFPGSGVPAAASCHSKFVASRFPDTRHACAAWNQSMHALGGTPGIESA